MWRFFILIPLIVAIVTVIEKGTEQSNSAKIDKALHRGYEMGRIKGKGDAIEKACEFFEQYLMEIGYPDDWCRDSKVQKSGEQRFREFMGE